MGQVCSSSGSIDIGPSTTIGEVLAARPDARPILNERGIDICCGAALSLADAAEIRGFPVEELLSALGVKASTNQEEPAKGAAIGPADSVRAVLARFPQTVAVFDRHGLMGCGGEAGPDERIDLFATIHRIETGKLLAELNEAAALAAAPEAEQRRVAAAAAFEEAPVFPGFIKAALIFTLTLGATFGAYNLLWIHLALGPVPGSHNWSHAGVQIFGFVLMFVMGVAYHALPRFFGAPLASRKAAVASLWLMIPGQLLLAYGRFGPVIPLTAPALAIGAAMIFLSIAVWAGVLWRTTKGRPGPKGELFPRFLVAGTAWWVAGGLLLFISALTALPSGDSDVAASFNEAIYAAALFGGALGWVQGMFLRVGPVFLNLAPTRRSWVGVTFWLTQAGAFLSVLGRAAIGRPGAEAISDVGLLLISASLLSFFIAVRPMSGSTEGDRAFTRIIRLSFAFSLLFVALGASYAITDLTGDSATRLAYDGARHAFALGFITLMIVGLAGRILPVFAGNDLRYPALRAIGAYMIAFAVLLRELQVAVIMDLADVWWLNVSGVSGVVAALGVLLASISLFATMRAPKTELTELDPAKVDVAADTNVARLIGAHPEAIPVLIQAGFKPLANPVLRRTLTRAVTLRQACRMHGVDVEGLVGKLRASCPHQEATSVARARTRLRVA